MMRSWELKRLLISNYSSHYSFSHLSFNSYRKIAKTTLALCNTHICAKTLKTDCKNYNFRYLRFDENVMILTCDSLRTLIELR